MSTQQNSPVSPGLDFDQVELVKAELKWVLESPGFKRSERHSRFLRFVCEATLAGESANLNECLIAHSVFDRRDDYSPSEDSVVRRQAFTLRQKLQEYYGAEGKNDAIRIELPVGRYVPTFKFPNPPAAEVAPIAETRPAEEKGSDPVLPNAAPRKSGWRWPVAVALTAAAFGLVGWYAGTHNQRTRLIDPVFAQIWGPLLSVSDGNVICFSNALTAGIRRTEEPFPDTILTRGILLAEDEADRVRRQFHLPSGGFFYMNPALAHAKMGEALGVIPLTAMFTRAGVPVRATQSRYLNWQDFRVQNLILLGHDEANQWLDPILSRLPFKQGRTTTDKPRRIVISEPKPGERVEYYPDYSKGQNPPAEDYALISFLDGLDKRHGLALINGVNTEGTMMALEYLTDPASLRDLESRLRRGNPGHSGAWHFQAILHSELRDGVPTGIELVAFRELP
jgi:hypothetical protein